MTKEQRRARNEAFQLLSIAERILSESGLTAYAEGVSSITSDMKFDSKSLVDQEMRRKLA